MLVAVAVPVLALAIVVWEVFQALHTFRVEDQIHGTFFPVSRAIEQYTDTHGAPPKTLEQLIPEFLVSIPASPYAYKMEYTLVDGSNWIMNVHSKALSPDRVYSWRSDWTFTDNEKVKLLKQFHNIAVFKE